MRLSTANTDMDCDQHWKAQIFGEKLETLSVRNSYRHCVIVDVISKSECLRRARDVEEPFKGERISCNKMLKFQVLISILVACCEGPILFCLLTAMA